MSVPTPILQYNLSDASVKGLLPSGYTPLAYIESSGTLYINTGWYTNSYPLKLETEIIWTAYSGEKDFFGNFGSDVSSSSNCFVCGVASNKTYQWGGSAFRSDTQPQIGEKIHFLFIYESASRTMVVNGVSKSTTVSAHTFLSHNSPIGVFSGAGNRNYCGVSAKMYYARIWSGNTLGVDLRPARRDSDGVIGMYDLVSRTFKTNSGSGTFIAGPELAVGKGGGKSLPEEYQLVEWIENIGNSYINTGLTVTSDNGNSYAFESMFTPTTLSPWSGYSYSTIAGVDGNTLVAYTLSGAPSIGNATGSTIMFTANARTKVSITFATSAQTYYVNGSSTGLSRAINTTSQILLFCGSNGYFARGRMEYAKFGTARNFIPCYRKSDMKPGMYDTVNGVFYTNSGSGEFILGPTITNCYTYEPNAGSGTLQGLYNNISGIYDSSKGWVSDFTGNGYMEALSYQPSSTFSIACWVKTSTTNTWKRIFWNGPASTAWVSFRWGIIIQTSGNTPIFVISDGSSATSYSCAGTTNVCNGVWHHLVGTYNSGTMKLYVDGNLEKTYTTNISPVANTATRISGSSAGERHTGLICNCMLFDVCLTDALVKELYGK